MVNLTEARWLLLIATQQRHALQKRAEFIKAAARSELAKDELWLTISQCRAMGIPERLIEQALAQAEEPDHE